MNNNRIIKIIEYLSLFEASLDVIPIEASPCSKYAYRTYPFHPPTLYYYTQQSQILMYVRRHITMRKETVFQENLTLEK